MRWIALLTLSVVALMCLVTGTASVLSATAVGSRLQAVAPNDPNDGFMLRQDRPQDDLKIQVDVVRHRYWYSTPEWVLGLLLAFVVGAIWLLLATGVRVPQIHCAPD